MCKDSSRRIITNFSNGDRRQAAIDVVFSIIDTINDRRELKEKKLKVLEQKDYDINYQYNRTMLKNFVKRKLQYYGNERKVSIHKIKAEIENYNSFQRNIIITGQAGSGKSTLLKWLFLNSNVKECYYIFLYAKMFYQCHTLDEVLSKVANSIPDDKKSIIFFDGLDELQCISGTEYEFNKFIQFFDKESNFEQGKSECKFVISSRPEHFEFNNMIIRNNTKRDLGNYVVFELGKLTKKESLKVCKSIKRIYLIDNRERKLKFINGRLIKTTNDVLLAEKKYLKLLKKYLNTVTMDDSLLDIPLLCRYAYQIVWEWDVLGHESSVHDKSFSLNNKLEKIIATCIKWEFHDEYRYQENDNNGVSKLDKYNSQVLDFLTELAGTMGYNQSISRREWSQLKSAKKIEKVNRAFCVLQEVKDSEEERLRFIHNTFQNYFLARYYVLMRYEKTNVNKDNLATLLKSNSEFAVMYIERLKNEGDKLSKKICEELLTVTDNNMEKITEFARGTLGFIYKPIISFTAEEYFKVFPSGIFIYAGIRFDSSMINRIITEGLLEIIDVECLKEFKESVITKSSRNILKGLRVKLLSMECIDSHFWIYSKGTLDFIYGFENSYSDEEWERINIEKRNFEHDMLFDIRTSMINFMGEEKDYWCLFDGRYLFLYQMILQNEEKMLELFHKESTDDIMQYITFYGIYKAKTDNETFLQKGRFKKNSEIFFKFDANQSAIEIKNDLYQYYDIHYHVFRLFRAKINFKDIDDEIFNLYNELENIMKQTLPEKLVLYFTDEQLYVLYMIGKGELMVRLADETMNLCEKYNHLEGIKLRTFLLRDDLKFTGDDLKKVYQFAKSYIWM